jgi:hypothetical protein
MQGRMTPKAEKPLPYNTTRYGTQGKELGLLNRTKADTKKAYR